MNILSLLRAFHALTTTLASLISNWETISAPFRNPNLSREEALSKSDAAFAMLQKAKKQLDGVDLTNIPTRDATSINPNVVSELDDAARYHSIGMSLLTISEIYGEEALGLLTSVIDPSVVARAKEQMAQARVSSLDITNMVVCRIVNSPSNIARTEWLSMLFISAYAVSVDRFRQYNSSSVVKWMLDPAKTVARPEGSIAYLSYESLKAANGNPKNILSESEVAKQTNSGSGGAQASAIDKAVNAVKEATIVLVNELAPNMSCVDVMVTNQHMVNDISGVSPLMPITQYKTYNTKISTQF